MEKGVIERKEGCTTYDDIQNKKLFPRRCRQTLARREITITLGGTVVVTLQGRPYDVMAAGKTARCYFYLLEVLRRQACHPETLRTDVRVLTIKTGTAAGGYCSMPDRAM
jgi:hypothetical protein